ncbi:hypothetical protein M378DRAFT_158735 [Amanita muscaria Koide BX008]|uniref:SnoaL-like domain-containing protein n=1 Tax=Amanita muscaria (strain Koide BX008) TaxID=946122 RepID=A0A0C2TM21_AMAMK|nr:hypothetical protein M378DRAFT_158735 [Amanita muscaria Koide BX008]
MHTTTYDPNSPDEELVPLPAAPQISLSRGVILQPPLTRRGTGPGLIVFLPDRSKIRASTKPKVLDPEPVQKWAEEGFAVAAVTVSEIQGDITSTVEQCCNALVAFPQVDTKDKLAVLIYDENNVLSIVHAIADRKRPIVCVVAYGCLLVPSLPTQLHLHSSLEMRILAPEAVVYEYKASCPHFVLPQSADYDPGSASVAHTRTLTFLRSNLGGPIFDLEAIWDEHTYYEFEVRSVAKTMGTMVAEPYVNHVPTMAGGIGRQELTAFYRDHFIFSNPSDARLEPVSRTVGADRVIDEFIFHVTHNRMIDWLLPGVPPSGHKLTIPMLAVVNIRGDRLYHEHIWWDQGTVLRQAGLLPTHLPCHAHEGSRLLRIPIAGAESAAKLVDEASVPSNEMLGEYQGNQ